MPWEILKQLSKDGIARVHEHPPELSGRYHPEGKGRIQIEKRTTCIKELKESNSYSCAIEIYRTVVSDFTYFVDGVESDLTVRVVNRVGSRFPLHCTAAGKVQIAHLDEKELQLWIDTNKLSKFSTNTIIDPGELKGELERILSQGYAIEDQEFETGVGGIAAPVINRNNKIIGAIGISAPVYRLSPERLENELVPLIKWAGKELSSKCGIH